MSEIESELLYYRGDSSLLDAVADYDRSTMMFSNLLIEISNNAGDNSTYEDCLEASVNELSEQFGEVTRAMYLSYGLEPAKEVVARLWQKDQSHHARNLATLTGCTHDECYQDITIETTNDIVEDIFESSDDADNLGENAQDAFYDVLTCDAQSFSNHIQARNENTRSILKGLLPLEANEWLNSAGQFYKTQFLGRITLSALRINDAAFKYLHFRKGRG